MSLLKRRISWSRHFLSPCKVKIGAVLSWFEGYWDRFHPSSRAGGKMVAPNPWPNPPYDVWRNTTTVTTTKPMSPTGDYNAVKGSETESQQESSPTGDNGDGFGAVISGQMMSGSYSHLGWPTAVTGVGPSGKPPRRRKPRLKDMDLTPSDPTLPSPPSSTPSTGPR